MVGNESLSNHYVTNFTMMQYFKYSLTELNDMFPWEREIYVAMLNQHIEEENRRRSQNK